MWGSAVQAGRVKLLIKGGKALFKAAAKQAAESIAKKQLRKQAERLTMRYGKDALEKTAKFAKKSGIPEHKAWRLLTEHGDALRLHRFSDEALEFAAKHKGAGVFFLRNKQLFDGLKKSVPDIAKVDRKVIEQAWRWGDDKAIGGSLKRLQRSLTDAGMNSGTSRDFCEDLFQIKARHGKIPGIPKGSELVKGHIGDGRQGIDFLLPEKGKVRVIEFGTGKKPIDGEMSWDRIRSNMADFLEKQDTNAKINLRGKGFSSELVNNPARIRDPNFPIEKFVQREVYATDLNGAELARAGRDITAVKLN